MPLPETPIAGNAKEAGFLDGLFGNGNMCITTPNGTFPVEEDMRSLLALFENGRFLVSADRKFDGRVLGFEVSARKKKLTVDRPEHVPSHLIKAIYERAV